MKSKKPEGLKVVLDTSVFVAALLSSSGGSAKIFELVVSAKVYNFYCDEILDEVQRVIQRQKFGILKEKQEHFTSLLTESSYHVELLDKFKVTQSRDPNDDVFLSLSNQIEAAYLISLDEDLLTLEHIGKTEILTPSAFLKKNRRIL